MAAELSQVEKAAIGEHAAGVREYIEQADRIKRHGLSLREYLSSWRIDQGWPSDIPEALGTACDKLQKHIGSPSTGTILG
jgi:hypothetical protein